MMATGPRLSITCPHCADKARVRTSRVETILSKRLNMECSNFDCRHTFVAVLEILHTVAPSHRPNPAVQLPMSAPRHRLPVPANDDDKICSLGGPEVPPLLVANDNECFPCAVATGG